MNDWCWFAFSSSLPRAESIKSNENLSLICWRREGSPTVNQPTTFLLAQREKEKLVCGCCPCRASRLVRHSINTTTLHWLLHFIGCSNSITQSIQGVDWLIPFTFFSGPPINLFHFFQSIHLLIRELMKKWEIVGPLYSNRPTSTNQKLFNNFIVLIY